MSKLIGIQIYLRFRSIFWVTTVYETIVVNNIIAHAQLMNYIKILVIHKTILN